MVTVVYNKSFADAESGKYGFKDIVCGDFAGDGADVIDYLAYVLAE